MIQPQLLLVEDDLALAELLNEYLTPQGYDIHHAYDGEQGLAMATSEQHFDLILLDVMLPKMDGFDLLKKLRETHLTPVLMLTAKGDDFDRIFGLELGADDYLPKPFNHRELSARIKALIRRMQHLASVDPMQAISVGNVQIKPTTQTASCNQQQLVLTGTEFGILHLLMQNAGKMVSKNELSEKVLGRKLAAFDRSIDMHVSNLRKKLNNHCQQEKIKTLRGSGYMFMVEV